MPPDALAFWVARPGVGETRAEPLPVPAADEVLVRSVYSGVSRGTERLVFEGRVPPSQYVAMRAPFQTGDFPGPVKYGYLSVGVVESGPAELAGRAVFCLHPHQTAYVVPAGAVTVVPPEVPLRRAVLAGTVETALNALWDAPPRLGDRVTVIGAGQVGCSLARLLAGIPAVEVTLVDVDPARAGVAAALGVGFALPGEAPADQDLVFHCSASGAGLRTALELIRREGTVVELSWYGDGEVVVPLGADFHARRLTLRASQVGSLGADARPRWTPATRLALALELLRDPAFDQLLTGTSSFAELPRVLSRLAAGELAGLCHTIAYEPPEPDPTPTEDEGAAWCSA